MANQNSGKLDIPSLERLLGERGVRNALEQAYSNYQPYNLAILLSATLAGAGSQDEAAGRISSILQIHGTRKSDANMDLLSNIILQQVYSGNIPQAQSSSTSQPVHAPARPQPPARQLIKQPVYNHQTNPVRQPTRPTRKAGSSLIGHIGESCSNAFDYIRTHSPFSNSFSSSKPDSRLSSRPNYSPKPNYQPPQIRQPKNRQGIGFFDSLGRKFRKAALGVALGSLLAGEAGVVVGAGLAAYELSTSNLQRKIGEYHLEDGVSFGRQWIEGLHGKMPFLPKEVVNPADVYEKIRQYSAQNGGAIKAGEKIKFEDGNNFGIGFYSEDNKLLGGTRPSMTYIDINQSYPYFFNALVALEDNGTNIPYLGKKVQGFWDHNGVNDISTARAAINKKVLKKKKTAGGSTLTQTLVGVLTGNDSPSIEQKIRELQDAAALEVYLERKYEGLVAQYKAGKQEPEKELSEVATPQELRSIRNPSTQQAYIGHLAREYKKKKILELAFNNFSIGSQGSISLAFETAFPYHKDLDKTVSEGKWTSLLVETVMARAIQAPSVYVTWVRQYYQAEKGIEETNAKLQELAGKKKPKKSDAKLKATLESDIEQYQKEIQRKRKHEGKEYTGKEILELFVAPGVRKALVEMNQAGLYPTELENFFGAKDPSHITEDESRQLDGRIYKVLEQEIKRNIILHTNSGLMPQWYREAVLDQLSAMTGFTKDQLMEAGLKVIVGYDPKIDAAYADKLEEKAQELGGDRVAAGIAMTPLGVVKSLHGNWFYGMKRGSMLDYVRSAREPSSTFKPHLVALALESGLLQPGDYILGEVGVPRIEEEWTFDLDVNKLPTWEEAQKHRQSKKAGRLIHTWDMKPSPVTLTANGNSARYTLWDKILRESRNPQAVVVYNMIKYGYAQSHQDLFGRPLHPNYPEWLDIVGIGEAPETVQDITRVNQFLADHPDKPAGMAPVSAHYMLTIADKDGNVLYKANLKGEGAFKKLCSPETARLVRENMLSALSEKTIAPDGTLVQASGTASGIGSPYHLYRAAKTGTGAGNRHGIGFMYDYGAPNGGLTFATLLSNPDNIGKSKWSKLSGGDAMGVSASVANEVVQTKPEELLVQYASLMQRIGSYFVEVKEPQAEPQPKLEQPVQPEPSASLEAGVQEPVIGCTNQNYAATNTNECLKFYIGGKFYTLDPKLSEAELDNALDRLQYAKRAFGIIGSNKKFSAQAAEYSQAAKLYHESIATALAEYHKELEKPGMLIPVHYHNGDQNWPTILRPAVSLGDFLAKRNNFGYQLQVSPPVEGGLAVPMPVVLP